VKRRLMEEEELKIINFKIPHETAINQNEYIRVWKRGISEVNGTLKRQLLLIYMKILLHKYIFQYWSMKFQTARVPTHPPREACFLTGATECMFCSERDCPFGEGAHYNQSVGCPRCWIPADKWHIADRNFPSRRQTWDCTEAEKLETAKVMIDAKNTMKNSRDFFETIGIISDLHKVISDYCSFL
jgi:hypothetical protein